MWQLFHTTSHSPSCITIQIRLFGGKTLVHTFPATDSLIDVNQFILMNRTDNGAPYSLMTNFPRHVFSPDEMGKNLKELGEHTAVCSPHP